ncbi:hypothetical protein L0657_03640 [Dyadobacter sp. CY345]|uniref:hypothetical protein n=1 Tax=Dyadobacter sp. CY345 TaxID=2909335 RepID=UPI001F3FD94E|nr:hypothetical protein [Dyadobacter sp. CY345]MCF2443038.1 hypothetical protein [Dyadobacter sp. CY345]
MITPNKNGNILPKLYCLFTLLFIFTVSQSCSETEPAVADVQYLVTNKSTDKISRLTVFIVNGDTSSSTIVDSVFLTNIPENLAVRLTYDITKNSAANGMYRLVAIGSRKKWDRTFGKFSSSKDEDSDHIYNLEIKEDSVVVVQ